MHDVANHIPSTEALLDATEVTTCVNLVSIVVCVKHVNGTKMFSILTRCVERNRIEQFARHPTEMGTRESRP